MESDHAPDCICANCILWGVLLNERDEPEDFAPPVPMISIPVAEHERLLKRAEFWEALTPEGWALVLNAVQQTWARTVSQKAGKALDALRTALEKQEG